MKYTQHILAIFALLLMVILNGFSQEQSANTKPQPPDQVEVQVDGMACPFCAFSLEKKLQKVQGVQSLDIRINQGKIILTIDPSTPPDTSAIRQKVIEAGFTPRKILLVEKGTPSQK